MSANEPACGNCGARIAISDIVCPACGALVAAYASPTGATSVTPDYSPTYAVPPSAPPSTQVHAPVETVSTAPRPLFDTYVTVEELVDAADSDGETEIVTLSESPAVEPVGAESPAYARPPVISAPPPLVEAEFEPEPAPAPPEPTTKPARKPRTDAPVGQTDAYLRKLHESTGYTPAQKTVSRAVTTDRPSPAQRGANRPKAPAPRAGSVMHPLWRVATILVVLLVALMVANIIFDSVSPVLVILLFVGAFVMKNRVTTIPTTTRRPRR